MIHIIDTHTHLCDPVFDSDRDDVLKAAKNAGVSTVILVSETLADVKKNVGLADKYSELRTAAGLYPAYLDIHQAEEIITLIKKERRYIYAIGEVGLDYWKVKEESQRQIQKEIFSMFIDLAREMDLPLNVHSRSAGRHAVSLLLESSAKKVQLHAFDGKAASAFPAVEEGYFFSIPPSIVRSKQKQNLVKRLPLSCLLVETDSPVLGPSPGIRNEPANAKISIDIISEIKNLNKEKVIKTIYNNTIRLYGKIFIVIILTNLLT
jgi:TatD DNase family protein